MNIKFTSIITLLNRTIIHILGVFIFYTLINLSCINRSAFAAEVPVIAAASSVQFALEDISRKFSEETGLHVKLSFGSSGNLARQISWGGPFEIFVSADENYVFMLNEKGLTADEGALYATGRLVFFVPDGSPIKPDKHLMNLKAALKDGRIKRFAIANPDHAPYGRAAKEVLISTGLWKDVQSVLVLGESVAQAAQFSSSGSVQGGIFSYSFALVPGVKKKGDFVLLPENLHNNMRQRMVLMKQAGETARVFYQFLQQYQARKIFERHGFLLADPGEQ